MLRPRTSSSAHRLVASESGYSEHSKDSSMNPITPHGAVVVNASYDYAQFTRAITSGNGSRPVLWQGESSDHRIEKKDMVFRHKGTCKRKRTSYNDPDLHVFGVCNGLEGSTSKEARKQCSFIGVSNTHLDEGSHRHASVTIAGLTTITNTGTERIEAGDKLVWDVPRSDDIERKRRPFMTMPYDTAFEMNAVENHAAVSACFSSSRSNGTNAQVVAGAFTTMMKQHNMDDQSIVNMWNSDDLKHFMACYSVMSKEVDARVIGTALCKSEPGNPLDILLRHSH
jgi:hypothetical protein